MPKFAANNNNYKRGLKMYFVANLLIMNLIVIGFYKYAKNTSTEAYMMIQARPYSEYY